MIFTKDLLLKGIAGLTLCTGTVLGGYYYKDQISSLFRKEESINFADLGLPPTCTVSKESISCTDVEINSTNVAAINFVGKTNSAQPAFSETNGKAKVTVTKESSAVDFPYGYKISITAKDSESTITVGSTSYKLKTTEATEFKIKKVGGTLGLEKAWTSDSLAKKVGLTKENNYWTIGGGSINVKHDNTTETKTFSGQNSPGKIKVYDEESYNKGIKFVIEEGDIALTGADGNTITKLEEFETYEIKEDSGTWKFIRKSKAFEGIKKALGLPSTNCNEPTSETSECTLNETDLKAIKFEGKGNSETTVDNTANTPALVSKIIIKSEENKTQYPLGYKFTLESNKNISFSNNSKHIKKDTNTEFKIKKADDNRTLTLEKVWNPSSLGNLVGLTCTSNGTNSECELIANKVNVHNGENNKFQNLSRKTGASDSVKVKYEEDQEGYNQGIKFYVDGDQDICLQGQDATTDENKKIEKKGTNSSVSYEIKQESNIWYLYKKTAS